MKRNKLETVLGIWSRKSSMKDVDSTDVCTHNISGYYLFKNKTENKEMKNELTDNRGSQCLDLQ